MPRSNTTIWIRIFLSTMFGILLTMSLISGIASAQPDIKPASARMEQLISAVNLRPTLPLTYARVITNNVLVYNATAEGTPIRSLGAGYLWVSLATPQPIYQDEQAWYLINKDEYVWVDHLSVYTPSTFHGIALSNTPNLPFAWMVFDMWPSSTPGEPAPAGAPLLKRYSIITIFEEQPVGDRMWYRVGEQQWIEQGNIGMVKPSPRPEGVGPTDRWIDIDLYEQTLAAYERERMVYATLVSSGLPWWSTEQGLFRVWVKAKMAKMSGREGYPDYYFLEDVPWSMYFNRSTALHGAYWHDRFGFRHSHGCVNISLPDARWLFDWVTPTTGQHNWTLATDEDPGTWVWVHDDGPPVASGK